jgi:DNA-binding FrmR family transcriptional regulator
MTQHSRLDHNKENIHRIRRIKGQLEALEKMLEADDGSCEDRVVRARTIEKGMTSLINHLVVCHLENTTHAEMSTDPDKALVDIKRLLELMNK